MGDARSGAVSLRDPGPPLGGPVRRC